MSEKLFLKYLPRIVRPIIRLLLESGISYREFDDICKREFVNVASLSYGIRGRPTNTSRISVITGLTRKEVRNIRLQLKQGLSSHVRAGNVNAPSLVLHYWFSDPEFLDANGNPLPLQLRGQGVTFESLCQRYAGDVPAGAVKTELLRTNSISIQKDGSVLPKKRHYTPTEFGEPFVRSIAFSLENLGNTLARNALQSRLKGSKGLQEEGLFERYVWSSALSESDMDAFISLAEERATSLLEELDDWVGSREIRRSGNEQSDDNRLVGLGIYTFHNVK